MAPAEQNPNYNPGAGAISPNNFNRDLFLVLFSLLATGMVLTTLYFFFVARNGGFHWKENDWDDYKTTVLRRKGPDGKTLSNATKSTKLGGGSIVGKWDEAYTQVSRTDFADDPEMAEVRSSSHRQHGKKSNRHDHDFNDYRQERPAAVGGYNKPDEGSHYTPTNTDPSTVSGARSHPSDRSDKKVKKDKEKSEKDARKRALKAEKEEEKHRKKHEKTSRADRNADPAATAPLQPQSPPSAYSYSDTSYSSPGSHVYGVPQQSPSAAGNSYYSSYRPAAAATLRAVPEERMSSRSSPSGMHRHSGTGGHSSSRTGSPRKHHREPSETEYTGSDVGTKAYPCHIPGVSKNTHPEPSLFSGRDEVRPDDSVSQVAAQAQYPRRGGQRGFRRGP